MIPLQKWHLHRILVDRAGLLRPFSRNSSMQRMLLITEQNPISQSQIFPFLFYGRQIEKALSVQIRELPLARFLADQNPYTGAMDFVFFQTWFDLTSAEMDRLAKRIKQVWPSAKLVYLDWFAPTDLRYAEALDANVTVYIKKQLLSDFEQYKQPTIGHTNLSDYYCKRFKINEPLTKFAVPETFQYKLVLGSSFEQSPEIVGLISDKWKLNNRPIDVHSRITTNGTNWYSYMRGEATEAAERLSARFSVAWKGKVSKRQYFAELYQSKICFSPFGYGEVCWRDFEAMSCGSLLLKPDMSHLKLKGDPFRPFETYVPVAWDLSDIEEKIDYYLRNETERLSIVESAFMSLRERQSSQKFLDESRDLWTKLGVAPAELERLA